MQKILIAILITASMLGHGWCDAKTARSSLDTLKAGGIENSSNTEIRELYNKLSGQIAELDNIEQNYLDELGDNAQQMKDKEQSTANKLLGAAGIGAGGIGGMMLASGMAEQNADADAETAMRAYLATFTCNYGAGKNVAGGTENVELPGGNELIGLYTEYVTLANDLKRRKAELGMAPGIESEPILESATSGLYDDVATGKTSGAYASLARALMDPEGEDAKTWAAQKEESAKNVKTGAITAGVGAGGSLVANLIVNKDAPKENSKKIKADYDKKKREQEKQISDTEKKLNAAIDKNKQKIAEYNKLLDKHLAFIKTLTESECTSAEPIKSYIDYIKSLKKITDDFADTSNLKIDYDINTIRAAYEKCVQALELQRKIDECNKRSGMEWRENKCQKKPVAPKQDEKKPTEPKPEEKKPTETTPEEQKPNETPTNADTCPATGNALKALDNTYKVGDACTSNIIQMGSVFKRKDGTCSCRATRCVTGYRVDKGQCIVDNTPKTPKTELLDKPMVKYYDVCGSDKGKTGGKEYCINKPFNWIQVQLLQGAALAAEYALVKHNLTVHCENEWREDGNDDFISCSTADNKNFFEFKFHDIVESTDSTIDNSVRKALCEKIYDGSYRPGNDNNSASCQIQDANTRKKLIASAKKIGVNGTESGNTVFFEMGHKYGTYTTKKYANIDPFHFFSGDIQIKANPNLIEALYYYSALQLYKYNKTEITDFDCTVAPRHYSGTIDNRKTVGTSDDILTCTINGRHQVDFVFDDLSELSKKLSAGGYVNLHCKANGGTLNGKDCVDVGQDQCEIIRERARGMASDGDLPYWDDAANVCRMPAAAKATEHQRHMNTYVMVGGIVVAAVVTVITAGSGAPIAAVILGTIGTVGAVVEYEATEAIYSAIDEFITESAKCRNPSCAEHMLANNLQRMANFQGDMTDAEIEGIDWELERLANLIPTDSAFYREMAKKGTSLSANDLGFWDWDAWEPEQIWRAVGITLQVIEVVGGAVTGIKNIRHANKLNRATTAIATRAKTAGAALDRVGDTANAAGDAARAADRVGDTANAAGDAARAGARAVQTNAHYDELMKLRRASGSERNKLLKSLRTKYHSDKVARFNSVELSDMADDIVKDIDNIDNLTDDEIIALSKRMEDFNARVSAAASAANSADNAASAANHADNANNADNAASAANHADNANGANNADNAASAANKVDDVSDAATSAANNADKVDDVVDASRMFGRTNIDTIGSYSDGWGSFELDGYNKFKRKKISYPGEADDVRRALSSNVPDKPGQAFLGVKDDYIIITYETNLDQMRPVFNKWVSAANKVDDVVDTAADTAGTAKTVGNSGDFTILEDGTIVRTNAVDDVAAVANQIDNTATTTSGRFTTTYSRTDVPTWTVNSTDDVMDTTSATLTKVDDTGNFTILEDGTIVRSNAGEPLVEPIDDVASAANKVDDVVDTATAVNKMDAMAGAEAIESEFEDLWRAYAPANQSLEDFKAMTDGDVVKMRNMTMKQYARDMDAVMELAQGDLMRLYKQRPDIERYIGINGFDDAAEKFPEVRAILDRSDARLIAGNVNPKFDKMLDDYMALQKSYDSCGGDPKCLQQAGLKLARMRIEMDNTPGFKQYLESAPQGNYSTFDPEVKRVADLKKANKQTLDQANEVVNRTRREWLDANDKYRTTKDASDLDEAISKDKIYQNAKSIKETLEDVGTKEIVQNLTDATPLHNVDKVAAERAMQLKNIVDSNPRYTAMKQKYSTMTREQRIQFAQELSDELLRANKIDFSIPVSAVDYSNSNTLGALSSSLSDRLDLTMKLDPDKLPTFEDFADTIAHEIGGHGIEKLAPNKSSLGAQVSDVGRGVISKDHYYYRIKPTEKEAYKIGDKTKEIFQTQ